MPVRRAGIGVIRCKSFRFYNISDSNDTDIEVAMALLNNAAFAVRAGMQRADNTQQRSSTCSLVSFVTLRART